VPCWGGIGPDLPTEPGQMAFVPWTKDPFSTSAPLMSLKQTSVTSPTNHSGIQSRFTRVALRNDKSHT
jgi:hypothetical protein